MIKCFKIFESSYVYNEGLSEACRTGDFNKVKYYISKGADVNYKSRMGHTPLIISINSEYKNVVKYLIENGADVELKDNNDYSPLLYAIFKDNLEMVKLLVESGANVNEPNSNGMTALHHSCFGKDINILKYLLENGADVTIENYDNNTPLDFSRDKVWSRKDVQEILLKKDPMNIHLLKKYNTPIHPDIKEDFYDLDMGSELGTI